MKNDTNQNNFETQKSASPEDVNLERTPLNSGSAPTRNSDPPDQAKDQLKGGKKVDVMMLDSESIISPVIAAQEPPKSPPKMSDSAVESKRQRHRFGSFMYEKRQLLLGLLIGFLLASGSLAAFLFIRSGDDGITRQTNSNISDAAPPYSEQTQAEKVDPDARSTRNKITINGSNPVEKTPNQPRVKTSSDQSETRIKDPVKDQTPERPDEGPKSLSPEDQTQLNTTFNNLIKATNDRNVDQQMVYYAPQVRSYYLARNASSQQIRDEKQKVFGDTESVDIQAGQPHISLGRDGRTATMLFRKKYSIKKGQKSRTGEVLQELKWVKSKKGWKIVSERDLKIIDR
jgi:hypothetical protein